MCGQALTVRVLLLLLLVAVVKAQLHLIRLLLLAAVGLGGLYMMHLLAQDYNKIRQPVRPAGGAGAGAAPAVRAVAKLLFRRSVDAPLPPSPPALPPPQDLSEFNSSASNFDFILKEDPKECARMVLCELATKSQDKLLTYERRLLDLLSPTDPGEASEAAESHGRAVLRRAVQLGRRWRDSSHCRSFFSKCPYSTSQALDLLLAP